VPVTLQNLLCKVWKPPTLQLLYAGARVSQWCVQRLGEAWNFFFEQENEQSKCAVMRKRGIKYSYLDDSLINLERISR
jgi:hypothetical protein